MRGTKGRCKTYKRRCLFASGFSHQITKFVIAKPKNSLHLNIYLHSSLVEAIQSSKKERKESKTERKRGFGIKNNPGSCCGNQVSRKKGLPTLIPRSRTLICLPCWHVQPLPPKSLRVQSGSGEGDQNLFQ